MREKTAFYLQQVSYILAAGFLYVNFPESKFS